MALTVLDMPIAATAVPSRVVFSSTHNAFLFIFSVDDRKASFHKIRVLKNLNLVLIFLTILNVISTLQGEISIH